MAKEKRDPNRFTIIERNPEGGPTLDEMLEGLHDWFVKVLITGEYKEQQSGRKTPAKVEDVTPEVSVDDTV